MARILTSRLKVSNRSKQGGQFRNAAVNKILNPLINHLPIYTEVENNSIRAKEYLELGYCFTDVEEYKKYVYSPAARQRSLSIGFMEAVGPYNYLSAFDGLGSNQLDKTADQITFLTRFDNVQACYYEIWTSDNDNSYLQKMHLYINYVPNSQSVPKTVIALHSDPDLVHPLPMYNGITHVHVGTDLLSSMHFVTSLTSRDSTFNSLEESDASFALSVRQIAKEFEREKFRPFKYL